MPSARKVTIANIKLDIVIPNNQEHNEAYTKEFYNISTNYEEFMDSYKGTGFRKLHKLFSRIRK